MIEQEPLFETAPSRRDVEVMPPAHCPSAVFAGIGLVSGSKVSHALPFDVLGLLLSAEHARRALSVGRTIVLVADTHAAHNGAPRALIERRAAEYVTLLSTIAQRCGLEHMQIVQASHWEASEDYRRTLRDVKRRLPSATHPYVVRETADIAHVQSLYGAVVKVGWALRASQRGVLRDERLFDDTFRRFIGGETRFVYAKAGRALDDQRQKVSPYVVSDASRRICLDPSEDVALKLQQAEAQVSRSTLRGVCNHLRAVTRSYGKLVRPLTGSVEERAQAIIDDVFAVDEAPRESAVGVAARSSSLADALPECGS